jgi:hypothetical protein
MSISQVTSHCCNVYPSVGYEPEPWKLRSQCSEQGDSPGRFRREELDGVETQLQGSRHVRGCRTAGQGNDASVARPRHHGLVESWTDDKARAGVDRSIDLLRRYDGAGADKGAGSGGGRGADDVGGGWGSELELSHRQPAIGQRRQKRRGIGRIFSRNRWDYPETTD